MIRVAVWSPTGRPLSVELGPGVLKSIYDGIQRPLELIKNKAGDYITRGILVPPIDKTKKWKFVPKLKEGVEVTGGDVLGEIQETQVITNRVMVPPGISGKLTKISEGTFKVEDTVAIVKDKNGKEHKIATMQVWPVRKPRPFSGRLVLSAPLVTGQRIIDTFFPVARGGAAAVPGGFVVRLGEGWAGPLHELVGELDAAGRDRVLEWELRVRELLEAEKWLWAARAEYLAWIEVHSTP